MGVISIINKISCVGAAVGSGTGNIGTGIAGGVVKGVWPNETSQTADLPSTVLHKH